MDRRNALRAGFRSVEQWARAMLAQETDAKLAAFLARLLRYSRQSLRKLPGAKTERQLDELNRRLAVMNDAVVAYMKRRST